MNLNTLIVTDVVFTPMNQSEKAGYRESDLQSQNITHIQLTAMCARRKEMSNTTNVAMNELMRARSRASMKLFGNGQTQSRGQDELAQLYKGTEMSTKMKNGREIKYPGKDLHNRFRLKPKSDSRTHRVSTVRLQEIKKIISKEQGFIDLSRVDAVNGIANMTLEGIIDNLYGLNSLGTEENPIEVRIANLDDVQSHTKDREKILRAAHAIVGYVAGTRTKTGYTRIAQADSELMDLIGRRNGGTWEVLDNVPMGIEHDDGRIEPNHKYGVVLHNMYYGNKYGFEVNDYYTPIGKLGYVYGYKKGDEIIRSFIPFRPSTFLQLKLTALEYLHIGGVFTIDSSSEHDRVNVLDDIWPYVMKCIDFGLKLSDLKFELYREMRKIKRLGDGKNIQEQRENAMRDKSETGIITLKLSQESQKMLFEIENAKFKQRVQALIAPPSVDDVNDMFGLPSGDDVNQKALPSVIVADEYVDSEPDYESVYVDGEYTEEEPEYVEPEYVEPEPEAQKTSSEEWFTKVWLDKALACGSTKTMQALLSHTLGVKQSEALSLMSSCRVGKKKVSYGHKPTGDADDFYLQGYVICCLTHFGKESEFNDYIIRSAQVMERN